ncbi:MAG TPA: hypothetical protein VHO70_07150 [Chitinispirillaceae bacterium]|nr:hypothetical protein [Chitinispirillaceae bacterium]
MESKSVITSTRLKKYFSSDWLYIVGILLIIIVVFSKFLFSNGMLYSSDQMSGLDSRFFLKDALSRFHQLPMWFSSRLGGMPSIDAMFGDPFYLPTIIFNTIFPVHKAIGMKMIFHLFLAGVFFYLLLRKGFSLHPLIAFAGGIFYMLNPQFLSHIYPGHDGKMFVIAWVPFVVWRLKALIDSPTIKNCTFLSFGISMILLTSHLQMSYFVLWVLGFMWIAGSSFKIAQKEIKPAIGISVFFWIAVTVALLISLVQLVPSYMYIKHAFSVRGVDRGIDFAASWSLHWGEVFSLWVPEFVNSLDYYWGQNPFKLNSEYAGAVALTLAVLGVISSPTKWRIFWSGVAVFAIALSLGAHSFVWTICYHIVPGVAKFRAVSMFMFWFSFSIVLLSSLFLKDLFSNKFATFSEQLRKKWSKGLMIAIGATFVLTLMFSSSSIVRGLFSAEIGQKEQIFSANFSKNFTPSLWLWFIICATILGLVLAIISKKIKPVTFTIIILLIGIFDLLRVDFQFIKMVNARPYLYTEPALIALQNKMKAEPFRCFTLPGTLPQNSEGIHGLEGVSGFHDNELRWYREFRGEQDFNYLSNLVRYNNQGQPYIDASQLNTGNTFLNLANVEYILARSQNELLAIKNQNALGRVSFAQSYVVIDSSSMLNALKNNSYDYKTTVGLLSAPAGKTGVTEKTNTNSEFTSKWVLYTPNFRKVQVHVPTHGFLRISEVYYPGWKILIDNKPVEVFRSDLSWMAVQIGPGNHTIEMKIDSLYLGKVRWVSIVTGLLLVTLLSVVIFTRKNADMVKKQ